MTARQRLFVALGVVVQLGLLIGALTDLRRRPAAEVNGPKSVWAALCFVNFVGPLAYFRFGRKR